MERGDGASDVLGPHLAPLTGRGGEVKRVISSRAAGCLAHDRPEAVPCLVVEADQLQLRDRSEIARAGVDGDPG